MSRALAVSVSSPCWTQWPAIEPASALAIVSPSRSSVSSMVSVHNKEPCALVGVRAVRAVFVGHLIAHAGLQRERAAVVQVSDQLAIDAEDDVTLAAPVIGHIARRIIDEPHPDVAELLGAPGRLAHITLVGGGRDAHPVSRAERNVVDAHGR